MLKLTYNRKVTNQNDLKSQGHLLKVSINLTETLTKKAAFLQCLLKEKIPIKLYLKTASKETITEHEIQDEIMLKKRKRKDNKKEYRK